MTYLDIPLFHKPICSIDFETTGLSHENGDRIIEVGIAKIDPDGIIHQYAQLINPERSIPRESKQIHGISESMVKSAPLFAEQYPEFKQYIDGSHIVAHNTKFDTGFLNNECDIAGLASPNHLEIFDTLLLARHVFGLPRCNLSSVSERFNVPVHNAHRALHDAYNTLLIFLEMVSNLHKTHNLKSAQELIHLCQGSEPKKSIRTDNRQRIDQAIKDKFCIELDYVSGDPQRDLVQRRIVQPIKNDGYRVLVYCHLRNAERSLRLNRILQIVRKCNPPAPD